MIDPAWAQAPTPGQGMQQLFSILPLIAIGAVFWLLLFRPQQQKAKEHRTLLANLKKNDEVITAGGLYGRVVGLADEVVTLEIAPNIRVRVSRPQISTVVTARVDEKDKGKDREK